MLPLIRMFPQHVKEIHFLAQRPHADTSWKTRGTLPRREKAQHGDKRELTWPSSKLFFGVAPVNINWNKDIGTVASIKLRIFAITMKMNRLKDCIKSWFWIPLRQNKALFCIPVVVFVVDNNNSSISHSAFTLPRFSIWLWFHSWIWEPFAF